MFRALLNIRTLQQARPSTMNVLSRLVGARSSQSDAAWPTDVRFDGSSIENPCTGCPGDDCRENPDLPPALASKISRDDMRGSVKAYPVHLVVCGRGTATTWPEKVENVAQPSVLGVGDVKAAADRAGLDRALVTAAERFYDWEARRDATDAHVDSGATPPTDGPLELLVLPHGVSLGPLTSQEQLDRALERVAAAVGNSPSGTAGLLSDGDSHSLAAPSRRAIVLVCSHGARDKRCGVLGPLLVDAFRREINARGLDDSVLVYAASHVGGHKYAGNVILYELAPLAGLAADGRAPERRGHWYGRVSTRHVPVILERHVESGQVVQELWRGQSSSVV